MSKVWTTLFLLSFVSFLSGCAEGVRTLAGVPDSVFEKEPVYSGSLNTVRELGTGYAQNTGSLLRANAKLETLCKAADRCEDD